MNPHPDQQSSAAATRARLRRWSTWIGAGVILALLLLLLWSYVEMHHPFRGWEGESVDVDLPSGLNAGDMMDRLGQAGVLRRPGFVRGWLAWSSDAGSLQAGEYRFDRPHTPLEVLERLRVGDVLLHRVTVPEGRSLEEVARMVADAGFSSYEELLAAFRDPAPVAALDGRASDLEGYLFPDTYQFPRGQSAQGIARAMVRRFREVVGPDFAERCAEAGLSVREAVTLASMVEKETALPEERPRIARVFHNRLQRGMLLQCDPTVIYALRRAERPVERLSRADLEFDSPWNTYRVAGLPPGPIANPGEGSLIAAIRPADGNDLYFVAAPGGGHAFSADLASHTRAVAAWRDYLRSSR